MSNEAVFAKRVTQINKSARKAARGRQSRRSRTIGSYLVTPLMLVFLVGGSIVYAWEVMERPTDNPLDIAHSLTAQVFSF